MRSLLIAMLFLIRLNAAEGSTLQLTLVIDDFATLPGLQPGAALHVTNVGGLPVRLPGYYSVELRSLDGEKPSGTDSAFMLASDHGYAFPLPPESQNVTLKPGQEHIVRWNASPRVFTGSFVGDSVGVLRVPGCYRIRFYLIEEPGKLLAHTVGKWRLLPRSEAIQQAVAISSAATLEVIEPSKYEKDVWQTLLKNVDLDELPTRALSPAVAEEILAKYPRSAYLPYMLDFFPPTRMDSVEEKLIATTEGTVADRIRRRYFERLKDRAFMLHGRDDESGAKEVEERALKAIRELKEKAADEDMARYAAREERALVEEMQRPPKDRR